MTAAADKVVAEAFRKKGYEVLDKGWPDLLVIKGRQVFAVELKRGADRLRDEQRRMSSVFVDLMGIPFYVAREQDLEAVMRKRGRIVVPASGYRDVKWEMGDMARSIAQLQDKLARTQQMVEESTAVLDKLPDRDERERRLFVDALDRAHSRRGVA